MTENYLLPEKFVMDICKSVVCLSEEQEGLGVGDAKFVLNTMDVMVFSECYIKIEG